MRRLILLALALVGAGGATASAATLTLTPEANPIGSAFSVTESGTTEEASNLEVYSQPESSPCGATRSAEQADPSARQGVPSGSNISAGNFTVQTSHGRGAGRYLVCGYLHYNSNPSPGATPAAAAQVLVVVKADSDGDGVPDDADACPTQANRTANGCPPDSDGDGVPDDRDRCPTQPGLAMQLGCPPPPDSDGDGTIDNNDLCPAQAGTSSQRPGCPADADGDGKLDNVDACPTQPSKADPKGCGPFTIPGWTYGLTNAHPPRDSFAAFIHAPILGAFGNCFYQPDKGWHGKPADLPCTVRGELSFGKATTKLLKLKSPVIDTKTAKTTCKIDTGTTEGGGGVKSQGTGRTVCSWRIAFAFDVSRSVAKKLKTLKVIEIVRTVSATGPDPKDRAERPASHITFKGAAPK